ncbi:hypothetical protein PFI31113_03900 [Pandoraea fibrosis]|uniref:Uncharacterized protein n=1 Tax=Pandoraea fibrosis TaxID=1891094 RepID=A0A5E4XKH0_9BURK|nr:hypothetical protein PFI31113_03900 [Pandoraea fibrosis]
MRTVGRPSRQRNMAALQSRPLARTVGDRTVARSGPIGRWQRGAPPLPEGHASTQTYGDPVVHVLPAHPAQRRRRPRADHVRDVPRCGIRRFRRPHPIQSSRQGACLVREASPPCRRVQNVGNIGFENVRAQAIAREQDCARQEEDREDASHVATQKDAPRSPDSRQPTAFAFPRLRSCTAL